MHLLAGQTGTMREATYEPVGCKLTSVVGPMRDACMQRACLVRLHSTHSFCRYAQARSYSSYHMRRNEVHNSCQSPMVARMGNRTSTVLTKNCQLGFGVWAYPTKPGRVNQRRAFSSNAADAGREAYYRTHFEDIATASLLHSR